jgi:1-aminocyclopropane-1-carboxylate deaminase/D-cysteine desulfhydrase-like pyridoxal-dependent ACC family enzyme
MKDFSVQIPTEKIALAMTPTPLHKWNVPGVPTGCTLFVKRDDLSGMQLSGNKVFNLE